MVETNIHHPTESSLIVDGVRKIIELCVKLYEVYDIVGWRQDEHLLRKVKQTARQIARIAARKGAHYEQRMAAQYRKLLGRAEGLFQRAGFRSLDRWEEEDSRGRGGVPQWATLLFEFADDVDTESPV